MLKSTAVLTLAAALATVAQPALAEGPHDKAITARQGLMQVYSFNVGILGAMARGKMDYDAEAAQRAATNLQLATSIDSSAMWPPGSDMDNPENKENEALPKLWTDGAEAMEYGKNLKAAVEELVAAAGNGADALKGPVANVGKNCKGCHDDFRPE